MKRVYDEKFDYQQLLDKYIGEAKGVDSGEVAVAKKRWDTIAKPLNGMGILEEYISRIYAINSLPTFKKAVAVMCADNGVVEEGVTQTGSEVTAIVAGNIMSGEATVVNMANITGADVFAYDVGMISEVETVPAIKSSRGTKNFAKERSMTRNEAAFAILTGIEIVGDLKGKGYNIIASGEMGIGNTTTSSAITAVVFDVDPHIVTGKGAGLTKDGVYHKAEVIANAIALHKPLASDPIDVLSAVGGYDIAAICGLFLGGMHYSVPVLIDGFISSVGALLATMFTDRSVGYMFASHMSAEIGAKMVMDRLGFESPLRCSMALGEGTGAVAMMPLIDMAAMVFKNMPTFNDIEIVDYKPLS